MIMNSSETQVANFTSTPIGDKAKGRFSKQAEPAPTLFSNRLWRETRHETRHWKTKPQKFQCLENCRTP